MFKQAIEIKDKRNEKENKETPLDIEYNEFNYEPDIDFNKNFLFEKEFISTKLKYLENKFLEIYDKNFFLIKQQKLKEFLREIQSKIIITEKDYKKLKEFAIEKGGFLTNENRQIIYRKIFFHKPENNKISILDLENENFNNINLNEQKEIKKISNMII